MLVLDGEVDYIMFDDNGNIDNVIKMGSFESTQPFYQTIRKDKFHMLMIRSEWLVFLEVTEGPFKSEDTVFAEWSPRENEGKKVKKFMKEIIEGIE